MRGKPFSGEADFCKGRKRCKVTARFTPDPEHVERRIIRVLAGESPTPDCGQLEYWFFETQDSKLVSVSLLAVASAPCLFHQPERIELTDPNTLVWYEPTHGAPAGPGEHPPVPHPIVLTPTPRLLNADDPGRTCEGDLPLVRAADW